MDVVEATISELRASLENGETTSVELVVEYLRRIGKYDRSGILLNSIPVLNPDALIQAQASDQRRASGKVLSPLDGIPYTVKDSYSVKGMPLAAGSPAFAELTATKDAFLVELLNNAGAVLIGRTTMPPMANGGMQRGLHGRAESPYNPEYLTAAFGSGSSNGSGTATSASFCAFGLGGETWSSGRAPATNNSLVAYTPSRGQLPQRGAWPLVPTMDVLVPHTRSVRDLLEVLDVLAVDDENPRGDFWRTQPWVSIPTIASLRPQTFTDLDKTKSLRGRKLGIPRMYINADSEISVPIETRASVISLWEKARQDLEALGATVVEVDFPLVSNMEADRPGTSSMVDRGFVPEEYEHRELWDLSIWAWNDFLDANGQPGLKSMAESTGELLFPQPLNALPDRYGGADFDLADYANLARENGVAPLEEIPTIEEGLRGLEKTREIDFEQWLESLELDALIFPAVADVGPVDADVIEASADIAWRNGTWVANGNLAIRLFGIPTVTVPMGLMEDIGMPVGLTFAGRAYSDKSLLSFAAEYESHSRNRVKPPRTPQLPPVKVHSKQMFAEPSSSGKPIELSSILTSLDSGKFSLEVTVTAQENISEISVCVNGEELEVAKLSENKYRAVLLDQQKPTRSHSEWCEPYLALITAIVWDLSGAASAAFEVIGGDVRKIDLAK